MPYTFVFCWLFFNCSLFAFQDRPIDQVKKADSLIQEAAFEQSKDYWQALLNQRLSTARQFSLYASKHAFCEAKLLEASGDFDAAVIYYKKALTLLEQGNASYEISYTIEIYSGLYHALAYGGNWESALEKGLEGKALLASTVKAKQRADYIYDLGFIYDRLGNYSKAATFYKQSIVLYESLEDLAYFDLGLAYNNLGTAYRQIGFFSERLRCLEQARFYWEKAPNVSEDYLLTIYGNLMRLYIEYGHVGKAQAVYTSINKLSTALENTSSRAHIYHLHTIYYTFMSETALAADGINDFNKFFEGLSELEQNVNSHFYLAALINLASHYIDEEHYSKATVLLGLAKRIGNLHKQHYYLMRVYTEMVKIAIAQHEEIKAMALLDSALALGAITDIGRVNEINILIKKATLQALEAPVDPAYQTIKRALSLLADQEIENPREITSSTFEKQHSSFFVLALKDAAAFYNTMYAQTGARSDVEHANYLYQLSAEVFALYYQNGEYNSDLNHLNKTITEGLFDTHIALETPLTDGVFTRILSNHSQVLRNAFQQKHLQFLNVEEDLLTERNLLHLALTDLDPKVESHSEKRRELQKAIQKLDDSIAIQDPMYASFYTDHLELSNIQKHLQGEVLIHYFTGTKNTYAITVTNTRLELTKIGATDVLEQKVTDFYELLQNPVKNTLNASQELQALLLGKIGPILKGQNVITFIPDGFLHYLPFEVLEYQDDALVTTHDVQYASSLPLWYLIKNTDLKPDRDKKLLAAFAPTYETGGEVAVSRIGRFKDLAGAKREAEQVATTLDGDLFLDDRATVANFTQRTTMYKIYHLAMHTTLDHQEHAQSSLLFYNHQPFDFSALYGLYFPADLVVLSACNTGIGTMTAGEGLLSLSRALTYAGVRSNVYSLWEVPDAETSEIMVSFYSYLDAGVNKASALAAAKRDFIDNNPLKAHPYYWAGFVVSGDTAPIKPAFNAVVWYWVGGIVIVFALLFYLRFRRQQALL